MKVISTLYLDSKLFVSMCYLWDAIKNTEDSAKHIF